MTTEMVRITGPAVIWGSSAISSTRLLAHLGLQVELYYARFADPSHTQIVLRPHAHRLIRGAEGTWTSTRTA